MEHSIRGEAGGKLERYWNNPCERSGIEVEAKRSLILGFEGEQGGQVDGFSGVEKAQQRLEFR